MKKLYNLLTPIQWLAIVLIVLGVAIMIPKAKGMIEFYKETRYAAENDFAAGNLSPDLIRPWMSLSYIAAAYAVPQQYLYDAANISPKKETSMLGINRINQRMNLGVVNGQPALLKTIREAIISYRVNPVVTGLLEKQVEDWMTMQYIANSTGIPVETFFKAINIPAAGNAFKPLGFLSDEMKFIGGKKALIAEVQKIVDAQGVKPVHP